jgi:long-chain acyl-CoA synthetase
MGLYDFTFYDLINRNAISFNEKLAWHEVDDSRVLTFAEFKKQVDCLAAGLQKAGIQKGDRFGVLGKNSLEFFLLYGAAAALGAIMLPINWRLAAEEVCFNLNDCEPVVLFVDDEYQNMIEASKAKLPSVQKYYNLKAHGGHFQDFQSLVDTQDAFDPTTVSVTSQDGFVIIHTAAVTGRPRGALLSHTNVLCANMHLNHLFTISPQDVHLNLLPLFHVGGLFITTSSFHGGALNVNMSKFDADQAARLIEEKQVTLMFDFAPVLSAILEQHEKSAKNIKSLRAVIGLDTPETIEKFQQATGGAFYCLYGQTETSCLATLGKYNDRPGSAGKTIPLADVRVVDDYNRPVETGQVGEIVMKGPMVFKGYWNLPEDNAYTFRDGWHHTGDLGRFDEDGFLWYQGRKEEKELIKPGGENVYPAEVEKVIMQHPAVEKTVVIGVPDPKWKEGIKAVCQLKEGQKVDPQELIQFVAKRIASYKKPHYVEFVNEMPLLKDGFPDRIKIKEMYGDKQPS